MTETVTLTINEQQVSVPAGTLVVDAAAALNIEIPIFCSHPKLDPVGCCRMCIVEFETPRGKMLNTACTTPVAPGMIVRTNTAEVESVQEANLAFILLNHPLDCPICDKGGECPLQDQTMRYGPGISQLVEAKRRKQKHYHISDTIVLDQERCVICWRCTRYLEEWEDKPQLGLFSRGPETIIDIQPGQKVDAKTSGNIIDICPVGALTSKVSRFAYRPWEVERTPSVCTHCAVGCNVRVDTRTDMVRRVVGRENMQVNDQWICDKGRFAYAWVNHPERLTQPLVRKDGQLVAVKWREALETVASRLRAIKAKDGADAIGGIGSAKIGNEANYLLQRFLRELVGTNHVDHRNGGDVTAIPTGLPALADLMQPQYGPKPKTDLIFLFGLDPSEELPILDLHLKRAVRRGGARLIIAHPRRIELTRYQGPYLGYRPGSEVALINGLTRSLLAKSSDSPVHLANWVAESDDDTLRHLCGVDPAVVKEAANLIRNGKQVLFLYGPMVAQGESGQDIVHALSNLAQVSGHYKQLGYVGLEANSQGCRDLGVLPNLLPGYVEVANKEARQRIESLWGCKLPGTPGKSYRQMLDSAGKEIKALYLMGADPAAERPIWAQRLAKLDLLVVQELFLTPTAQLADVVLPALGWMETDATFTNLERRVQRAPQAVSHHHSKAAPDWLILDHLAGHFGKHWPYTSARSVTAELGKAAPIYRGITWEHLGDQGLPWNADAARPRPTYQQAQQRALPATREFPLTLIMGTVLYDGGRLVQLTDALHGLGAGAQVVLHPSDAAELKVADGTPVQVSSRQGTLELLVKVDDQVQPGTAWIPESLPAAPVGTLLNGNMTQRVKVSKR